MGINSPSNSHHITRVIFVAEKPTLSFFNCREKLGIIFEMVAPFSPIWGRCLFFAFIASSLYVRNYSSLPSPIWGEYAYFYLFPKHFLCSQIAMGCFKEDLVDPKTCFIFPRDASPGNGPPRFFGYFGALVNYFHFHRVTAFYWCFTSRNLLVPRGCY